MRPSYPIKVLVIDDDIVDRELVCRYLTDTAGLFVEVSEASNFVEAHAAIDEDEYDCIILDYIIPPYTGLEFISQLRKKHPERYVGIILLTGNGDEYVAVEAMKAGVDDYLNKDHLSGAAVFNAVKTASTHASLKKRGFLQQQALTNFARTIVRDLKDPLSGIIGYLELSSTAEKSSIPDELQEHIRGALDSATYMQKVVDGIHNYVAKNASPEPKLKLQLNEIIRESWRIANDGQQNKATLNASPLPEVIGRPNEIIQLFQNLFENAIQHAGSEVQVTISSEEDSSNYTICVEDDGPGVPQNQQADIFVPLNKAAKNSSSIGLGLATCVKIIENHNGKIWCSSDFETGARFYASFPKQAKET